MRTFLLVFLAISVLSANAQTATTQKLDDRFEDGLSLYFYKNTLRMLNQNDNKDFDELIKDIEKMKFLMIDKEKQGFTKDDYKKLLADYRSESYEEMMTSRFQGRNFDVYLREKSGEVKGTVILASDSSTLYVLDILGKVALDKVTSLFQTIDNSTDIGMKIKRFAEKDNKKGKSSGVKID